MSVGNVKKLTSSSSLKRLFISKLEQEFIPASGNHVNFWKQQNRSSIFKLSKQLRISKLFQKVFVEECGENISTLLQDIYPHELQLIKSNQMKTAASKAEASPPSFAELLRWLEAELNIKEDQEWYRFTNADIASFCKRHGMYTRNKQFLGNFIRHLVEAKPNLSILEFKRLPSLPSLLTPSKPQKAVFQEMIDKIESELMIENKEEWYRVSEAQMKQVTKFHLVKTYYGSIYELLRHMYPNYDWSFKQLAGTSKKSEQRLIYKMVKLLFPEEASKQGGIIEDYLHPTWTYPNSDIKLEFDIYLPNLNLAIEYNGEHHYQDVMCFGSSREYKFKDEAKKKVAQENGMKLVVIDCFSWRKLKSTSERIEYLKNKIL